MRDSRQHACPVDCGANTARGALWAGTGRCCGGCRSSMFEWGVDMVNETSQTHFAKSEETHHDGVTRATC